MILMDRQIFLGKYYFRFLKSVKFIFLKVVFWMFQYSNLYKTLHLNCPSFTTCQTHFRFWHQQQDGWEWEKRGNVGKLKFENQFCPAKLCAQSAPFELNLLTLEPWVTVNEKLRKCVKINGPILFKWSPKIVRSARGVRTRRVLLTYRTWKNANLIFLTTVYFKRETSAYSFLFQ